MRLQRISDIGGYKSENALQRNKADKARKEVLTMGKLGQPDGTMIITFGKYAGQIQPQLNQNKKENTNERNISFCRINPLEWWI